ncbi:hypothetical protein SDJN02_13200, partial [Cucurbita argyrosperma subsp. argyrosperma]
MDGSLTFSKRCRNEMGSVELFVAPAESNLQIHIAILYTHLILVNCFCFTRFVLPTMPILLAPNGRNCVAKMASYRILIDPLSSRLILHWMGQ